jgi:hypothetical protein
MRLSRSTGFGLGGASVHIDTAHAGFRLLKRPFLPDETCPAMLTDIRNLFEYAMIGLRKSGQGKIFARLKIGFHL